MKKGMIAVIGLFCAAPLFAQSYNTTYYAPNGGCGGSAQSAFKQNTKKTNLGKEENHGMESISNE